MSEDNFNITIKGLSGGGEGGGSSQKSPKLDISALQKSVNAAAAELKKINSTQFQKNLDELTSSIRTSARSAMTYTAYMKKAESQLASAIQKLSQVSKANNNNNTSIYNRGGFGRSSGRNSYNEAGNLIKSVSSLKDSIEKLNASMKDGFKVFKSDSEKPKSKEEKEKTDTEKSASGLKDSIDNLSVSLKDNQKTTKDEIEKPKTEKEDKTKLTDDVKKIMAAVGIGSLVKQFAENEIVAPARMTGMLISSNVVSNPQQAGAEAIQSYQSRQAGNTKTASSAIGGVLGGLLGSVVPGFGTAIGAGIGYGAGSLIGDTIGESHAAKEGPTLIRGLTSSYYSNIASQQAPLGAFANAQYGAKGFGSSAAFQDPYLESRATLGRSFSRFAGGNLSADTTSGILKSLTAQGASSPQELATTGNLLGQIARFTGKSSLDIEKLYKNVERTGMNPNEGLQKTLSLLQSGMSTSQAEKILSRTSQRSEAFENGQSSYFNSSPFHQFMSQQVGKYTGVNPEEFFKGDEKSVGEARRIFKSSRETLSKGGFNEDVVKAEMLNREGITSAMAENNLKVNKNAEGKDFLKLGSAQEKVIDTQNKAIIEGAKGRGPDAIVNEALSEIGKSTQTFSVLQTATHALSEGFTELKSSVSGMIDSVEKFFHFSSPSSPHAKMSNKSYTQTPAGR
jgi:uncharacterized protein YcfJ